MTETQQFFRNVYRKRRIRVTLANAEKARIERMQADSAAQAASKDGTMIEVTQDPTPEPAPEEPKPDEGTEQGDDGDDTGPE